MEQHQVASEERPARKRAARLDVLDRRAAVILVSGIQAKLDRWHQRVAFLKALAAVSPLKHEVIGNEAGEQMALVIAARIEWESEVAHAPARAAAHSLIRDVARSLRRLQAELEQLSVLS